MKSCIFKGVATALYTPFNEKGVDYENFERLIYRQLNSKIDCLVILGTTGESSTISEKERTEIIKFTINLVNGKIPVVVGTGTNDTSKTIKLTKQSERLNADGVLIVTPYYNKCEQDGLIKHYETISSSTRLPIICYNVPSRTGVNIEPETFKFLKDVKNIVGIKEASNDQNQIEQIFKISNGEIAIYSGNDNLNFQFLQYGASGFISVASNVIPLKIKDIYSDFINNYEFSSREKNKRLTEFYKALFYKVNPIPIKAMAEILYGEKCFLRLPLLKASEMDFEYFKKVLKEIK